MSHFKAKMQQIRFRLELRPPLGEPTALPDLRDLRGPMSKGKEWMGKGERREGM